MINKEMMETLKEKELVEKQLNDIIEILLERGVTEDEIKRVSKYER